MGMSSRLAVAALLAVCACEKPATSPLTRTDVQPQASIVPRSDLQLAGTVTYYIAASKTHEVLNDGPVDASATLEFLAGHAIRLTMAEPVLERYTVLEGDITPSGVVTMVYVNPPAEVVLAIVGGHTGCTINGGFPVYHGKFDGVRLVASTEFNSQCPVHWEPNNIFPTPVQGAVHMRWTIDMAVGTAQASTRLASSFRLDNGNPRIIRFTDAGPQWFFFGDASNGLVAYHAYAYDGPIGPGCEATPWAPGSFRIQNVIAGNLEDVMRMLANWNGTFWIRVFDTTVPGDCQLDDGTSATLVAYGWGTGRYRDNDLLGSGVNNMNAVGWMGEGALTSPAGGKVQYSGHFRLTWDPAAGEVRQFNSQISLH